MSTMQEQGVLKGLDEIAAYARMGKNALRDKIEQEGFPAHQLSGKTGPYFASKSAVDAWWEERLKRGLGSRN